MSKVIFFAFFGGGGVVVIKLIDQKRRFKINRRIFCNKKCQNNQVDPYPDIHGYEDSWWRAAIVKKNNHGEEQP